MVSRRIEVARRPNGSMNRNRTIAQQVGQADTDKAGVLAAGSQSANGSLSLFCRLVRAAYL